MASPETFKDERPAKRQGNLVELAPFIGVSLLLGGLLTFGVLQFLQNRADDDERPPVIVRNGSVHIEVTHPASDGDKGKFEKKSDTEWLHKHTGKGGPSKFTVVLTGLVTSTECPTTNFSAYPVRRATLTYTYNGNDYPLGLDIDGSDLRFTTRAGASVERPTGQDFIIRIDSGARLKSISLWRKKKGDADETTVSCTLGANSEIVIVQRK